MINDILQRFDNLILRHEQLISRIDTHIIHHKGRIIFYDNSVLVYTEIDILSESRRKYSYQWMSENGNLIIRWDNAEHHPHISTHLNHKHIGNDDIIESSEEMTLQSVLGYISTVLGSPSQS